MSQQQNSAAPCVTGRRPPAAGRSTSAHVRIQDEVRRSLPIQAPLDPWRCQAVLVPEVARGKEFSTKPKTTKNLGRAARGASVSVHCCGAREAHGNETINMQTLTVT
eukprot:CAMPEP_0175230992 /NCGR_PEP_ID=MMETSP0093-20121207/25230_1 /TAXON_ID=311494 /ORGANISM="Alexandrium monilatum, Strain CCMP3105" /LENGTH=106 /DNA_ID=CAMNT_0016524837 /DNA_START=27 /DNA_END=344 /DNA_ORIENTATION=+